MASRGLKLVAAVVCFVIAGVAIPSPAAAVDETFRRLVYNQNDDKCLNVESGAADSVVYGGACFDTFQQKWDFIHIGTDTVGKFYQLKVNSFSKPCLLARTWGADAYKAVGYPCLPYDDQYWYIQPSGGYNKLVNKASSMCLVHRSWQYQVEISACGNYADQVWGLYL